MRSSTSTRRAGSTADSRSTTSFSGSIRRADQTPERVDPDWVRRQALTFELAEKFLRRHEARGCKFEPIGVAQGWSAGSYAAAVTALQDVGYARVALGGMVPLKTPEILRCLDAVAAVLESGVEIHLLGVTRLESITRFGDYGVTSFDSTSPFRQAFMDADDNYYQLDGALCAVRIPQSDGNTRLRNLIGAGQLPQDEVRALEDAALAGVRAYADETTSLEDALDAVCSYEELVTGRPARRADYETTLAARPWDACVVGCAVLPASTSWCSGVRNGISGAVSTTSRSFAHDSTIDWSLSLYDRTTDSITPQGRCDPPSGSVRPPRRRPGGLQLRC